MMLFEDGPDGNLLCRAGESAHAIAIASHDAFGRRPRELICYALYEKYVIDVYCLQEVKL